MFMHGGGLIFCFSHLITMGIGGLKKELQLNILYWNSRALVPGIVWQIVGDVFIVLGGPKQF